MTRTTLHVAGGWTAALAAFASAAERFRTERVALAGLAVVTWIAHDVPSAAPEALAAVPWLVAAVAGRAAVAASASAVGARRATQTERETTDPGRAQ